MDQKQVKAFFDALAGGWDATLVRNEAVIRTILDNARIAQGQRVLDVACGTGVLVGDYLARGVASVTGIDLSPNMIAVAKEKYHDARVEFICEDVEQAQFDAQFDRVMLYNAFPHFPEPARLVAVLAKHLKTGGILSIAHGMSREKINQHHNGSASAVSMGLIEAEALKELFLPYFDVDICISDDTMYQVSGVKR